MLYQKNDIELLELERELMRDKLLGLEDEEDEDHYKRLDHYYYKSSEHEEGPHYIKPGDFYLRLYRAKPEYPYLCDVDSPGDDFWRKPDRIYESYFL